MKQFNLRLYDVQIDILATKANSSEYIRGLIMKDQNKPVEFEHLKPIVFKMVLKEFKATSATELISRLALMLTEQLTGTDQLNEILRRAEDE